MESLLRDNTLEKGLWICADPRCVLNVFTAWLRGVVVRSKRDCTESRTQLSQRTGEERRRGHVRRDALEEACGAGEHL